jgi:hypothetical protein
MSREPEMIGKQGKEDSPENSGQIATSLPNRALILKGAKIADMIVCPAKAGMFSKS